VGFEIELDAAVADQFLAEVRQILAELAIPGPLHAEWIE
jgi:hypothetical protein